MRPDSQTEPALPEEVGDGHQGATPEDRNASVPAHLGVIQDFHSAEFNRTDDLNDSPGDFRFEGLDGVITADMRHQMERVNLSTEPAPPQDEVPGQKSGDAEAIGRKPAEAGAPLTITSYGRVLIIATDAATGGACGTVLDQRGLATTLLVTGESSSEARPKDLGNSFMEAWSASVAGSFGSFTAAADFQGHQEALGEFDIVLDLQPLPSCRGRVPPMGYYAPGRDAADLRKALTEIPWMTGRFEKPRFIFFEEDRCLHGRCRFHDCNRCLDACPLGAIGAQGATISLDAFLCQGCGACALACPAGALRLARPTPAELLEELRLYMAEQGRADDHRRRLVISDREPGGVPGSTERGMTGGEAAGERLIHFAVSDIGHVGLELLLSAFDFGASAVDVAIGPRTPEQIVRAVEDQVRLAGVILERLGRPARTVRIVAGRPPDGDEARAYLPTQGPHCGPGAATRLTAPIAVRADRHALARSAAQHLYDCSGLSDPELPLPDGSPFGCVSVGADCTLCMACASACTTGALSAGGKAPRLEFVESRCHQCGLCALACPERAMKLSPRLLCDPESVDGRRILRESGVFRCVECGAPFASSAMVDRIAEKLAGHWMYASERQLRRLRMCRTCRASDALSSQGENSCT